MSILTLTHSLIANDLQCPAGKRRVEICDTDLPGLYVEVRACSPGQGTFYLRYKDRSGKTCHQKIGRTAEIGLTEARKQARALKAEIALGADPRGEARQAALTFAVFFEDRYLPY